MRLLSQAYDALAARIAVAGETTRQRQSALSQQRLLLNLALREAVVNQLVAAELPTLPGIGPRLAALIISSIFQGQLSDLHQASSLEGIGPQKQAVLNQWVAAQEWRLPDLVAGDFPGKAAILAQYEPTIERLTAEIAADEAAQADRRLLLSRVYDVQERLKGVTVADFERALLNPGSPPTRLHHYQLGVFPPWEPPPDWFVAALEAAQLPTDRAYNRILVTPSSLDRAVSSSDEDDLGQRIYIRDR